MRLVILMSATLILMGIFVYTINFARWLWKKKQLRGSIGVAILAFLGLAFPLSLLFFGHH